MLKIEGLYKKYKDTDVLKGVNLHVATNEIKALIGINGSGKSTLIEIVCGIKTVDKGSVSVNNIDLSDRKHKKEYKKMIGYAPQSFALFNDLTVQENLEYVCAVYGADEGAVEEVMKLCLLYDSRKKLAGNLSGGYKQLLSCACSIIHKPKLLILDEPTSAMDPIFRKKFWSIIDTVKSWGTSVLIVTHFIEELLECDTFACLSAGEIKYDGNVSEFEKNGFIDIEKILAKYSGGAK